MSENRLHVPITLSKWQKKNVSLLQQWQELSSAQAQCSLTTCQAEQGQLLPSETEQWNASRGRVNKNLRGRGWDGERERESERVRDRITNVLQYLALRSTYHKDFSSHHPSCAVIRPPGEIKLRPTDCKLRFHIGYFWSLALGLLMDQPRPIRQNVEDTLYPDSNSACDKPGALIGIHSV